jgi:hypothetical protein
MMVRALERLARMMGVVLAATAVAGVAFGVGARVVMRVVALTDAAPGTEFTVGGTVGLIIGATMATFPFVLLFLGIRRFLPQATRARALAYGLGLLAFPGVPFLLGLGNGGEITDIGIPLLNRAMFGALFVGWGAAIALAVQGLGRRIARPEPRRSVLVEKAAALLAVSVQREMVRRAYSR